jgi:hypothetical protein
MIYLRSFNRFIFIGLALLGLSVSSEAATVNVDLHLANSETIGSGFDLRLDVEVGDDLDGLGDAGLEARFIFSNLSLAQGGSDPSLSGWNARIKEIYFESGLSDDLVSPHVDDTNGDITGLDYRTISIAPSNPPGINPSWNENYYAFDEQGGSTNKGVEDGQSWSAIFDVAGSAAFVDAVGLAALLGNDQVNSRIAIHVGSCDGGESCVVDTWTPGTSPVPVPAAIWLFGTALIGLVGFGKRKSKVAV